MSARELPCHLVFTDLDGSLLDHHHYGFRDAEPQLSRLQSLDIPVIPASSKTRLEIEHLRGELANRHPFIAENGAGVFIPAGYFANQPQDTIERDGYWVYSTCPPRETWLALLESLQPEFAGQFDYFHRAGVDGICQMTNLSRERAADANLREFSEPVKWLGDEPGLERFLNRLQQAGASVLKGGRFLSVGGDCDKGRALIWLREVYRQACGGRHCHDIAIGDSANDCAMLEVAETALLIRSPVHEFPALRRDGGVIFSKNYGPVGWAEGVALWLQRQNTAKPAT